MRLLLDQDVYAVTARHLRAAGHDVVTVGERRLTTAADTLLLEVASAETRLLVTRDRDFGELVFVRTLRGGVIYLRMLPSTIAAVHAELDRVLASKTQTELSAAFVVIEPGRHRIRRLDAR